MDGRAESGADIVEQLADGLWRRLRDVILVAERIETYSFTEHDDPANEPIGTAEADALALDLVVRALHAAGDPDGWRLLACMADREDGTPLGELAELLDRPRLAVAERVNGLVQAGLAQRALDLDRAFATVAGETAVAFVRAVAARLGHQAATFRAQRRTPDGGDPGDGLPVL